MRGSDQAHQIHWPAIRFSHQIGEGEWQAAASEFNVKAADAKLVTVEK
jgi:hypothetical protein